MKKFTLIAAVVFTTITLQSCRQSDDFISSEEAATLKRVQDSSTNILRNDNNVNELNANPETPPTSNADGELVPPPRK